MFTFLKQVLPLLLKFRVTSSALQFMPLRFRLADIVPIAIVIGVIDSIFVVHPFNFFYWDFRDQSSIQCRSSRLCFILVAECDPRLSQLTNITFSLPHKKHVAINCCVAMSLPMHSAMLASLLSLDPTQVITCSDQGRSQHRAWAHNLSDYKSRLVIVKQ